MKVIALFFILVCSVAMDCFAQTPVWSQFSSSPDATTRHDDICFVSRTHGWSARGRDGIYRTTDGGNTWTKVLTNNATHFRSIGFVSETVGFAGNLGPGSYDTFVTDTNLLYRTDDGGNSWSVVPGLNETGMKGFCAIQVLDSQHIFAGGRVRGPAHFTKSTDGGDTWTVVDLTEMGVMGGIMDVYFKDPLNGFVIGMDTNNFVTGCGGIYFGRIARTTDGGATWTPVVTTSIPCSYFWKMSWPTPNVGYVSLQQNGTANRIIVYKTTDGGDTWTSIEAPYSEIGVQNFLAQGIGFISETEGWLGGANATSPYANNFLHTTNGGVSWNRVGYNDSRSINK
ncbi:MAG: WD40/YVTN/BNR-like repeat-containing protein, partial [Limisphaerales bacterium]